MKRLLKSLFLLFLSGIIACNTATTPKKPATSSTTKIELHNSEVVPADIEKFEQGVFKLKNGQAIRKNEVKAVTFISDEFKPADVTPAEPVGSTEIKELMGTADEAVKKHPSANGIILLDDGAHLLNPDGTRKYRYHFIGKIITNKTRGWADHSLYFEEERDRVKVVMGRTITPDGKVIPLDLTALQITEPARDMAFFGRGKILTFSLPAVENGCLIEYIYETETFNPWDKNIFEPGFFFQDTEPLLHSRVTITIPSDKSLNHFTQNIPAEAARPKITTAGNMTSYFWELKNMEPLIEEAFMPDRVDVVPRLACSMFKDWAYLHQWGGNILRDRIKITPEISETVRQLTKEAKTPEEKIAALYYFTQRNIRYISIKGSMSASWGGHPAQETLENKYGDCIDKSILFSTMLKEIGIEAYPVTLLTNDAGTAIRNIPIMDANHAITELRLDGKRFYLDPVTTNFRYPFFNEGDHGVSVVNEITGEINFINVPPPEHNLNSYQTSIILKPNGDTEGDVRADYTGPYEANLRSFWETVPEEQRQDVYQRTINNISPGGRLMNFKIANLETLFKPLQITYQYVLPRYPIFAGDLMIFGIPGLDYKFDETGLDQRQYDLVYNTSRQTKNNITIKIPEGYRLKYLPADIKLECRSADDITGGSKTDNRLLSAYASYEASYEYQPESGLIIFKDNFQRFQRIIPARDYQKYKEFLQQVSRFSKEKIFLEKIR